MSIFSVDASLSDSFVYALLCQDRGSDTVYIKFGMSSDVGNRITALRTASPIPARYFCVLRVRNSRMARRIEKALHMRFADRRSSGEWFRFVLADKTDKKEFNEGCSQVFTEFDLYSHSNWWDKISMKRFDEHNKAARAAFLNSKDKEMRMLLRSDSNREKRLRGS